MGQMTEEFARQNQETEQKNPFNVILGRWREAEARRLKEDEERRKEEADLKKSLMGLQYEYNYKKELEKIQTEEANKREFGKAILEGGLTKIPQKQVATAGGRPVFEEETIQGAPQEEGEVSFKGTPFEAITGKQRYKITPKPDLSLTREERISKNQDLARASQLRKEFIDRPEVKEFVTVRNKVKSMNALLQKAVSGNQQNKVALDQGLITLFNKITDPNSVVRESEYARTPQNISLANRFSGALQKIQKGGAGLTDDDRKSLVWGAKVIANEQGKGFNERLSQYQNIAGAYNIDPELITSGIEPHQEFDSEEQQAQSVNSKTKAQRANEIARANPKLSNETESQYKQRIIQKVNQEFNQ